MIVNHIILEDKYKCNKKVMEYLVFKCHLPILGIDGKYYYFANTEDLRESLKAMPLSLRLTNWTK